MAALNRLWKNLEPLHTMSPKNYDGVMIAALRDAADLLEHTDDPYRGCFAALVKIGVRPQQRGGFRAYRRLLSHAGYIPFEFGCRADNSSGSLFLSLLAEYVYTDSAEGYHAAKAAKAKAKKRAEKK